MCPGPSRNELVGRFPLSVVPLTATLTREHDCARANRRNDLGSGFDEVVVENSAVGVACLPIAVLNVLNHESSSTHL